MLLLQLDEATAAQRRIPIYLVDATNGYSPETGLSSGFTIEVSENGATQASGGGSITEIGEGQYYYEATAAELSTLGFLAISIRHASCRDFFAACQVVAFDPYDAYSTHSAADVWTAGSRALSTPADYKATGFSTHSAADVWTTGSRELSTPANYKATGFSTHAAADIWSVGTKEITGGALTTPADYKATGFSTHSAADVWTTGSRELSTPANYKATGFSTHSAADIWTEGSRALSTPNDYKATGFSTHTAANVWGVAIRELSGTISDFDALDTTLDSAHGAGSWLTGGAGGATIQVIPSIPKNIDLSNTKTVRIALYMTDQNDDLPTTTEIDPGTITIDRSADGGTSWSNIVNAAACDEHAGAIYYDEVFDSGTGYASADMIRITFKGQKCTISANDHEIADSTDGMIFTTRIDSGLSGGGPSAGDIADAVWDEPIVDHTTGTNFGGKNQKVVPSETIADYKATGFSTHAETDVWTTGSRELSTPADYKATGFSTHSAANVWGVGTREITGGALTTPADYKATGFSTHSAADIWTEASRALSTPADYKATGFSTHAETDVWTTGSRELSTPNSYKADVSGLATTAALTTHDGKLDTVDANVDKIVGISMMHCVLEFTTYDGSDNQTAGKMYVYDTKANATTNNHSTGLLHEFTLDATFDGSDRPTLRRWVEEP